MKLPAFVQKDDDVPRGVLLVCIGAADRLHVGKQYPDAGTLCGANGYPMNMIGELFGRRRPVCRKCRALLTKEE